MRSRSEKWHVTKTSKTGNSFTAVCCAALYSAGPITAHYCVAWLLSKLQITRCKSTGKPQAAALSVFHQSNYAALALAQCEYR